MFYNAIGEPEIYDMYDLEWLEDIILELYLEGKIDALDCWNLMKDL